MKIRKKPSELIFVVLIFVTATRAAPRANPNGCCNRESTRMHVRTYDRACLPYGSAMWFQIEELASCSNSNSTDAAALGYSHLLLRCEGEIRFKQILPFLLASGVKLHFSAGLLRRERSEQSYWIEVPWSRGRRQPVDSSDKEPPEPFSLPRRLIKLATLYDPRWLLAG